MSVSVAYMGGRFGESFTSYAAARLFAELNGLEFRGEPPPQGIVKLKPPAPGKAYKDPFVRIDDAFWNASIPCLGEEAEGRYVFSGYFQRAHFFAPHRERIKAWLDMPPVEPMPDDAICMHVRLGDYRNWPADEKNGLGVGRVISPEWYFGILKELPGTIHIVSDESKETLPMLQYTPPLRDAMVSTGCNLFGKPSPFQDFHFMRRFKTVLCSNSTFAWWAQFLGVCEKCYTFKPWVGPDDRLEMTKFPWAVEVDGEFWKEAVK